MKRTFLLLLGASLLSFVVKSKPDTAKLNELIDNWHLAAAKGDFNAYFGATTEDFIFLGTDPVERWTKDQFEAFAKPYFDKGQAWDFKPKDRMWVFADNGKMAWFDEKLDTWMEECRGSGIVVKRNGEWKLIYYNLTVLIENDKIKDFIEVRRSK